MPQRRCFSEKLKYSQISPVFKKGGVKTYIHNYRHISVLSNFSKIFVKVINLRLVNFFENNNSFYSKQFGSRKHFNTGSALIQFTNDIVEALDKSQESAGVFCDVQGF